MKNVKYYINLTTTVYALTDAIYAMRCENLLCANRTNLYVEWKIKQILSFCSQTAECVCARLYLHYFWLIETIFCVHECVSHLLCVCVSWKNLRSFEINKDINCIFKIPLINERMKWMNDMKYGKLKFKLIFALFKKMSTIFHIYIFCQFMKHAHTLTKTTHRTWT